MKKYFWNLFLFMTAAYTQTLSGCTDFTVHAQDGSIINGRSLEFGLDLESQIAIYASGERRQSDAPNKQRGLSWTSKYGYVGIIGLGLDLVMDGLNEKGLSTGALWFPTAQYQSVPSSESGKALSISDVGHWILGNFASVAEVKEALGSVYFWGAYVPQLKTIPPLHIALHDAQGNNAVIEFIGGKVLFSENPVSVLTNYPSFDWQMTNLDNYVNLRALNAGSIKLGKTVLGGTGQGTGMLGIPGDWTPPSRFVRMVNFKQFASPPETATEGVILALHLLNTVDIPKGDVLETDSPDKTFDYTQWIVIKDLTNRALYYRTYNDMNIHKLDFKQWNIRPGSYKTVIDFSNQTDFLPAETKGKIH